MPRRAREKSAESMYHVMTRSISERDLFRCDADRDYYISLLKRYKEKYRCSIYAYCLMDNHVHLFINPNGCDISRFMHGLNLAYVIYFNKRYERHGHLQQERFASRVVDSNTYALTLMAYIHNNASDLPGYDGAEESYKYSSYGIYTCLRPDTEGVVDTGFLLGIFSRDVETARRKCCEFTRSMKKSGIMTEMEDSITGEYTEKGPVEERRLLCRDGEPGAMVRRITDMLGECTVEKLRAKHIRETGGTRAFTTYALRILCGYTYRMISGYIGDMSVSGISRLFREGYRLVTDNPLYRNAFNSLLQ